MSTRSRRDERSLTLEDEFFFERDQEMLTHLREVEAQERTLEDLRAISGIEDEGVLARLVDAGVSAQTLMAFNLAPLVAVAWQSGGIEATERAAVLRAASERGIAKGTPAYEMLERMLGSKPAGERMLEAWIEYARCLYADLGDEERRAVARGVVGRAREIAEVAGGFLGAGAVSSEETAVLDRIEAAFR